MEKEREQSFSEYLDKENMMLCRFVFTQDYSEIEAFSVSMLAVIREKATEVIRFDCSAHEKVNVHRFYKNPATKQYLEKEKSFETLQGFWENIKNNWRLYLAEYKENHRITENNI